MVPAPVAEERLRLAVEASGEVVFLTDRSGILTYVNPEFTRVYGYTADEVVGCATPRILKCGLDDRDAYAEFWSTLLTGQVVRREFVNRTRAGRYVRMEST